VIADNSEINFGDSLKILVDGVPPSSFQGCYFITRPYNNSGKKWLWELPSMIQVKHTKPWVNEEWTCTFTYAEPPFSDFSFNITGSVTGPDGEGKAGTDFVSRSGRVIIRGGDAEQGGDWHLNWSFQVLKTITKAGDEIKWKTYSICLDYYRPAINKDTAGENCAILFQGIPNSPHL
jgi:hypothetical protein